MPPEETEAHIGEIYRLFNENFARALANTRTLEMVDVQLAWLILRDLYYYYKKQYEENSDESVLEEYIFCIFKVVTVGYNVIQGSDKGRATNKLNDIYARPRRKSILNLKSFPQTPTSPLSMNIYTGTKYPGTFCSA